MASVTTATINIWTSEISEHLYKTIIYLEEKTVLFEGSLKESELAGRTNPLDKRT